MAGGLVGAVVIGVSIGHFCGRKEQTGPGEPFPPPQSLIWRKLFERTSMYFKAVDGEGVDYDATMA